ncbi:MAG: PPK2 family polyphosphate kinase [Chitinophagaceae bacterium]
MLFFINTFQKKPMPAIRLDKISTRAPKGMNKDKTKQKTDKLLDELNEMQNLLYAESKHSVLIILQALDAGGKDGLVRNVFGKFNPQGVLVQSFKVPTAEELAHDFLWRIHKHTPAKGYIQVFNRSQYEDVLVTRVHKIIDDETAMERMQAINNFEKLLTQNNTHILKFYLHISPDEQKKRLDERIQDPRKQWKYNENDFTERKLWKEYMAAYQDMFKHCNDVPWTILPSDQNWYKEYIAAEALHTLLKSLNMQYPGIKK